ncbi:hypothetical protein BN2497_6049 [Janthinobacterium sp. CG23_2]|nr:hypothetical protein BN2497_6049 [Janthinobacterium sp. CG23_2]CUU29422.1 hypothetical protein BN3177_6049 [Janthinobacterium sp. CG23_2]
MPGSGARKLLSLHKRAWAGRAMLKLASHPTHRGLTSIKKLIPVKQFFSHGGSCWHL